MTDTRKTKGQLAYEADCEARPLYHDGTKRRTWEQLSDVKRWSWERPPLEVVRFGAKVTA